MRFRFQQNHHIMSDSTVLETISRASSHICWNIRKVFGTVELSVKLPQGYGYFSGCSHYPIAGF